MEFERKHERHRRFWQPLENGEGNYLAVTSVSYDGKPNVEMPPPKDFEEQWLSIDYRVRSELARMRNTRFALDAIPTSFANFGPGVHAALLGAPYKLQPNSVWFDLDPPLKSYDPLPIYKTDPNHLLFIKIDQLTKELCAASKGEYHVGITDIGGQMDILFSLRGEELLIDLLEYPDEILKVTQNLDDEFLSYFNYLTNVLREGGSKFTAWINIISDEPWFPIQCDMSVMISPKMFEKFVLPSLDRVSRTIGRSIYHLDGPEEIQHLDMLLSLPYVHAIQWVPLPFQTPGALYQDFADKQSLEVYKRTLAAGKKVVIMGVHPSQVEYIFNETGGDGVFAYVNHWDKKEADEFIEHAGRLIKT